MSAREEIFRRLAGAYVTEDRANALIDAYAHELAQQLRDVADEMSKADDAIAFEWRLAAKCIEPEEAE